VSLIFIILIKLRCDDVFCLVCLHSLFIIQLRYFNVVAFVTFVLSVFVCVLHFCCCYSFSLSVSFQLISFAFCFVFLQIVFIKLLTD